MRKEEGFSLIELLVVILVIAILAAIAVPVFLAQRERGWKAQVETALKNAATSIESYGAANDGSYSSLNGADSAADNPAYQKIVGEGFKRNSQVHITVDVPSGGNSFCLTATHVSMSASNDWKVATYNSSEGSPSPSDVDSC